MYPKKFLAKILKDFWRIKYRTTAIILTIAVSVAIYIGTHTTLRSINGTCARLYQELNLADLQFNFVPATEDELPKAARSVEGVERIEKRLILPGSIEAKNDELIATLLVVLDEEKEPEVNRLKIMKGTYFNRGDRKSEEHEGTELNCVLLDYTFAKERGYDVDDRITLGVQGFFTEFKISGLVVNAEHLITSANPDFYMPIKNSLGIAYIPMRVIKDLFGYRIYNNFALTAAQGADIQTIRKSFENLFLKNAIELDGVLFRDDLFS
ncbi:MAG: ABC transporter permease, partial [bacterium]